MSEDNQTFGQSLTRRELEKGIRQAEREQRASERRFRRAWHEFAGRRTWWQRLAWELGFSDGSK